MVMQLAMCIVEELKRVSFNEEERKREGERKVRERIMYIFQDGRAKGGEVHRAL